MLSRWGVPAANARLDGLRQLANSHKVARHAFNALETGIFEDGRGGSEPLGLVRNPIEQVALIAWLAGQCQTRLTVEVGFGMGITASLGDREYGGFQEGFAGPEGVEPFRNILRPGKK